MPSSPRGRRSRVVLEKPMALTLADCDAIIAAAERNRVHSSSATPAFDSAVRLMRDGVVRGELARLGLIHSFNCTTSLSAAASGGTRHGQGGGILFDQVPRQIDTARLLAGGMVRSVRAQATGLDPSRPTEGSCAACCNSKAAPRPRWSTAARTISIPTNGIRHRRARRAKTDRPWRGPARAGEGAGRDEGAHRTFAYGTAASDLPPHQPHFGVTIVTCAEGDIRASADGVTITAATACSEIPIPRGESMPGRREVLDDMRLAIARPAPVHDGRWGKATVEVALAILRSAREGRDVALGIRWRCAEAGQSRREIASSQRGS